MDFVTLTAPWDVKEALYEVEYLFEPDQQLCKCLLFLNVLSVQSAALKRLISHTGKVLLSSTFNICQHFF